MDLKRNLQRILIKKVIELFIRKRKEIEQECLNFKFLSLSTTILCFHSSSFSFSATYSIITQKYFEDLYYKESIILIILIISLPFFLPFFFFLIFI